MKTISDYEWEIEQMYKAVEYYQRGAEEASNAFDRQKLESRVIELRRKIERMEALNERENY